MIYDQSALSRLANFENVNQLDAVVGRDVLKFPPNLLNSWFTEVV